MVWTVRTMRQPTEVLPMRYVMFTYPDPDRAAS
jgi:hypothetical protein